jgi:outer membrane protein W
MELALGMEKSFNNEYFPENDAFRRTVVRSYPVELLASYHVQTNSDWKPFFSAGARYARTPGNVMPGHYNSVVGQFGAGVMYNATERLGIRFDAKYVPLGDVAPWNEDLRLGIGASWRF